MNKNKILLALALLSIAIPSAAAERYMGGEGVSDDDKVQGEGIHEPGTGLVDLELKKENVGTGLGLQKEMNATSSDRRSRVANEVREMLQVTDRQGGIGQQIREIAGKNDEDIDGIEQGLKEIKNRGQFRKFLFGPDYKKVGEVEAMLLNHSQKLEQLKALKDQVTDEADKNLIDMRIKNMEEIKIELQKETDESQKGFSLFGWLNRIIFKK